MPMAFRNKILFSIWGVVLGLLVFTFFIINYWTRSRIEASFSRELRSEHSVVAVREQLQSTQLIRACVVIAESPRLRAVVEVGDAGTAAQLLQDLNRSALSQIAVLTDRHGGMMVQLLNGRKDRWNIAEMHSIRAALQATPSTDVWSIRGRIYRVVSVPILIGNDLLGTLTLGFEITRSDIATLRRGMNSDLLLLDGRTIVSTTMDSARAQALLPVALVPGSGAFTPDQDSLGTPVTLAAGDDTYLATAYLLSQEAADADRVYLFLVKPLGREVRQAMASILSTFALVSVLFLGLTTIIGIVISRGMTRPIQDLVTGTTEIIRGNYDYALRIRGKDEFSTLAQRFAEMSATLKEKITELGKLNEDLRIRNIDLDDTLQRLQSAQAELLRSERLAVTGKMTAQLAHEINNPIHNILSCLKTALGRLPEEARGRDLIAVAFEEVERLSRLTVQMLDFYRTSLLEIPMNPTSISDLIQEVLAVTRSTLHGNNIVGVANVEDNIPPVLASKDKLMQVLLNLIANARDAMPGGGRLELAASRRGNSVRIDVRDQGAGIPKEHLGRIFDAFFTTKGKVSGVGLGLSVSYGIVRQHRGTIDVESTVGEGSTFTIILPLEGTS
jgi:signal transduction histidine kinase